MLFPNRGFISAVLAKMDVLRSSKSMRWKKSIQMLYQELLEIYISTHFAGRSKVHLLLWKEFLMHPKSWAKEDPSNAMITRLVISSTRTPASWKRRSLSIRQDHKIRGRIKALLAHRLCFNVISKSSRGRDRKVPTGSWCQVLVKW